MSFEPPAECEGAEGDIPEAVVAGLEVDVCADAGGADVAPWMVPPEAPVGTDIAPLEPVGVFQRWPSVGHRTGCGVGARGWGVPGERLVRALAVALLAEAITRALLSPPRARWRAGGGCLQRAVQALMAAMLSGVAGLDALGEDPQAHPPGGAL